METYRDRKIFLKIVVTLGIVVLFLLPGSINTVGLKKTRLETDTMVSYNYVSDHELLFSFKLQELIQDQDVTEHGTFTTFNIPNAGFIGDLGKPRLPVVTCIFAVPTLDVSLNVVDAEVAESSWVGRVYPAQSPQSDSETGDNTEFIIDESFYQQDIEYPGKLAELVYDGKIRDICFVKIEFYPVQYNPKQEIATIYDEITIKLSWDESEIVTVESGFDNALFTQFYENVFENWQEFLENTMIVESQKGSGSGSREEGCDYLIITHPDFYSEILELAEWKHSKGFFTKVVDTDETGSTSSQIQQYIQNLYDNGNPRVSYVLLVGDAEYVPTNYEYSAASDLWYATVSGSDYYPDIFIGRIPVDTSTETQVIVEKILKYEQTPPTATSYYEDFAVAAYFQDDENNGYETRRFVRTSEEVRDYLLSEGYDGERIYCTKSYINPTHYNNGYYGDGEPLPPELLRPTFAWDGDAADIINAIESGVFILNHRDHGSEGGWGDPYFQSSHIAGLTNGDLTPVVFSINCLTGKFDNYDCFCEKFIRKDGGGAVAIFGASRVSYSGYNDFLCRGFYDAIWPDFDENVGGSSSLYSLGEILNYGKTYMANTWGDPWGYERLTFELFHCFGDPSMEIWTAAPQELDVTHPDTVGSSTFIVHVETTGGTNVNHAYVCLSKEDEVFLTGYTNSAGDITFYPTPSSGGVMYVTVTKHNFRPYMGEATVPEGNLPPYPPSNPYPPNGATNIGVMPTLSWTCGDPNGDPVTYCVYLEANDQTPDVLVSHNQSETSYTPPYPLDYNTHYWWRIIAWDPYGESTVGIAWDFFTKEGAPPNFPPVFSNEDPHDGATGVPITTSSLSVYIADPEENSFDWSITTSPDVGSSSGTGEGEGTKTCSISGLDYSTIYTWYVSATDPDGSGETTEEIYTFTTEPEPGNEPPNAPIIDGEGNGDAGTEYEYSFKSIDPDDDDIAEYIVDWGDGTGEEIITGPFASGEEAFAGHTWAERGDYIITAKAKDINGFVGPEGTLTVTMPRNKVTTTLFQWFQQNYPNLFPILQRLLLRFG